MEFLTPAMFAAFGLIPVVILLHVLRPKPKPVEVTNLFLWQELLKDRGGNLTFKRLQKNLPLLLQILLIILATLALARPVWLQLTKPQGNLIVVVDTSASMKTRIGAETRFDLAKQKTLELIDEHAGNHMLLIAAGSEPVLSSGFTDNVEQLKALTAGLTATDAPGKLEKALYLAQSFVAPGSQDRIYLVTDGAGTDFLKLLRIHQRVTPIVVGGGENNAGITKFEFRQIPENPDAYEMMVELRNFGAEPVTCPFRLVIDKTPVVETPLTLGASEKRVLILPYSGLITGILKAELALDDDFQVDNQAYLTLNAAKDLWVLFVSQGNYFLERLLEAYPNFLINKLTEVVPSSWEENVLGHDLVIVDRMDVPATTKGNVLLIDAFSPSVPATKTGQVTFPEVLDWDKKHPILSDVNLSGLKIEQAEQIQATDVMHPLVESAQTGLMYTYEHEGLRTVLLGFDLTRSDLPLKIAFPVMMSNIVNWLNPHKLNFSIAHTKAGEPVEINVGQQTTEISVRSPDGKWEKYPVTSDPLLYQQTQQVGTYTILENKKSRYFTVNLLDAAESDIIAPAIDAAAYTAMSLADVEITAVRKHLWMWLLLAGMAVILGEWYAWLKVG